MPLLNEKNIRIRVAAGQLMATMFDHGIMSIAGATTSFALMFNDCDTEIKRLAAEVLEKVASKRI